MQSLIAVAIILAPAAALTAPPARARPRRTALKSIKVTYIEPDAAAEMGVREWPFSDRKDGAEEPVPADESTTAPSAASASTVTLVYA